MKNLWLLSQSKGARFCFEQHKNVVKGIKSPRTNGPKKYILEFFILIRQTSFHGFRIYNGLTIKQILVSVTKKIPRILCGHPLRTNRARACLTYQVKTRAERHLQNCNVELPLSIRVQFLKIVALKVWH